MCVEPEGWYQDPFGVQEHRWISLGRPTALVRDAGVMPMPLRQVPPAPGPPPKDMRGRLGFRAWFDIVELLARLLP